MKIHNSGISLTKHAQTFFPYREKVFFMSFINQIQDLNR
jgi:hypothetical protein